MNWLDIAIMTILALAALLGARTGLVGQIARLAALVTGVYGAIRLNDRVSPLLAEAMPEAPDWLAQTLAYAFVFLVIYALLLTITLLLERGVKVASMQGLNRFLGSALGAIKAGLILGLVFLALAAYLPDICGQTLQRSVLAHYLSGGAQRLVDAIPEEYKDGLRAQLRQLEGLQPADQQHHSKAE